MTSEYPAIAYRSSLPRATIWEFSSSSDEEAPVKKQKIQESPSPPPAEKILETKEKPYGPTLKQDIKAPSPKYLENLGYINRNIRPPNSKRNEILSSLDIKKPEIFPSVEERKEKERKKIDEFKSMIRNIKSKNIINK